MNADSPFLYPTEVSVAYNRGVSPLIAVGGAPPLPLAPWFGVAMPCDER
jgi:hypothetical protein